MTDLRELARDWLERGREAVVVSVIAHQGSVPRETGTRMLVAREAIAGTIGGGHLELRAIEQARLGLTTRSVEPRLHLALGPALGQCCGGAVTLGFDRLDAAALAAWAEEPPRFRLQLYGAGHVGRAIVQALAPLNVEVDWIDERDSEFPADPTWPCGVSSGRARIRRVAVDAVEGEVARGRPGHDYLVLTHSHDLDLRITQAILERGDFGYLGLIGSATKRARFVHRFERRGIAPERIARMTCPMGVPGIAGKEPEVIAAAVVAQLLQQAVATDDVAAAASVSPPAAPGSR